MLKIRSFNEYNLLNGHSHISNAYYENVENEIYVPKSKSISKGIINLENHFQNNHIQTY